MTVAPLLSARDLTKAYGAVKAVDGVSLDLKAGEILAMIGPNGAGKSTCFDILSGQIVPDCGSVRIGSVDVVRLPPERYAGLGVARTFQIARVFDTMTVRENVETVLCAMGGARGGLGDFVSGMGSRYRESAEAVLERVGLAGLGSQGAAELAYGDRKRLELAMALANDPKILLMDEPTAGMAPGERHDLMAMVADIVRRQGLGMLFTEHDMDAVFAHADRLLVLDHGRVIAEGTPDEVRRNERVRTVYLGGDDEASGSAGQ